MAEERLVIARVRVMQWKRDQRRLLPGELPMWVGLLACGHVVRVDRRIVKELPVDMDCRLCPPVLALGPVRSILG